MCSQITCRGVVYTVSAIAFAEDRRLQLVLRDGHYGCWTGNFTPECELRPPLSLSWEWTSPFYSFAPSLVGTWLLSRAQPDGGGPPTLLPATPGLQSRRLGC